MRNQNVVWAFVALLSLDAAGNAQPALSVRAIAAGEEHSLALASDGSVWEWGASLPGDPLGFAPHLRWSTLPGVPMKRVLFQFGIGDLTMPNPCETNLVRAANMRETTSLYRHDLTLAVAPDLPKDPHLLSYFPSTASGEIIARAAQREMVEFLASDGARVPDVNYLVHPFFGKDLFGVPQFLPEGLNY